MRTKLTALVAVLTALMMLCVPSMASAAEDTAAGTLTNSNIAPTAGVIAITDMSDVDVADINPDVYYKFKITVTDNNSLEDIKTIVLKLYYPSTNENGTDAAENHYTFIYTAPDTWQENNLTGHLDVAGCSRPATLTNSSGQYVFKVEVGTAAIPTSSDNWTAKFIVTDNSNSTSENSKAFDVNEYIAITIDDTTLTFSGSPGQNDRTPSEQPSVASVTSNVNYDIDVKLSGTWTGQTYAKTIAASQTQAAQDAAHEGEVVLSTSYQTLWSNVDESVTSKDIYWFLDIPTPLRADTYTVTFNVQAVKNV